MTIERKISVSVALIHNNNIQRNIYIRPQLDKMAETLVGIIAPERIEVSLQPEIRPHSIGMAFLRDVMYRKLDREWHKYRLLKPIALMRDIVGFLKGSFIKYIINRKYIRLSWQKNSAIEVLVTDKHIRAWSQFLDSDADYLIVFEDDVVFKEDSNLRINRLLDNLTRNYLSRECYVDLAGGSSLADLMISRLETCHDDNYRYYQKPVTNTACAYLISRELIIKFNEILIRKPWLRLIGIDWMINSLFISTGKDVSSVVCMHADPTIFRHGTTTGEYISWQVNT